MTTGIQERDDETGLAGLFPVVSGPPQVGDPVSIGSLAALIVSDASVRMRGRFSLPRLVAFAAREEEGSERP